MSTDREAHRSFLNAYYGKVKHVYDLTRRYYLFGRDRALDELLSEPWDRLVEVGPGTGRNLARLRKRRPTARYGGVEPSDEMLRLAKRRHPWAVLLHGFGEDVDLAGVLGDPPERILFSYSLSMIQEPARALENARRSLAPGGSVHIVDFGDMAGLAGFVGPMRRFLEAFHVTTPDLQLLSANGAQIRWGPGRYYLIAKVPCVATQQPATGR